MAMLARRLNKTASYSPGTDVWTAGSRLLCDSPGRKQNRPKMLMEPPAVKNTAFNTRRKNRWQSSGSLLCRRATPEGIALSRAALA